MSNLIQRLILFFVGIPLFFAVVVFLPQAGHAAAVACVLVVNFGSALELAGLFKARGYPVKPALFGAIGIVVPLLAWAGSISTGIGATGVLGLGIALLAVALFSPFALARKEGIESALPLAASYGFALVYPGLMGACIVLIAAEPHYAVQSLISFAALTFGNDSLAWLSGVTLGKKRGIVEASPNKSAVGFIGGMLGSVGLAFAATAAFPRALAAEWWKILAWGLCVGAAVIAGDLFESALKRSAGAKDSGSLVPGRGGFLDSFDSLLFAAPVYYGLSLLFGLFRQAS